MPPILLLLFFLSLQQVHGTSSSITKTNKDKLHESLNTSHIFVPGYVTMQYKRSLGEYFNSRVLFFDLTDMFHEPYSIPRCKKYVLPHLNGKFISLNIVQLAILVYQLDGLLEFSLLKKNISGAMMSELRDERQYLVKLIAKYYPHHRIGLDLVSSSPSLHVQNDIFSSGPTFSPFVLLNHVDHFEKMGQLDPFQVVNLRGALVALLSSRLEDPSVGEYEKQMWMAQFADFFFWMSDTRVAMCIAAMLRTKRCYELTLMQFNITLEQWRKVSDFLSPSEFNMVPQAFQNLIRGQNIAPMHFFMSKVIVDCKTQIYSQISNFTLKMQLRNNDVSGINDFMQKFDGYRDYYDAVLNLDNLVDFCIASSFLSLVPSFKCSLRDKFPLFIYLAQQIAPGMEIFSSCPALVSDSPKAALNYKLTLEDGRSVTLTGRILVEALASLSLIIIRSFRHIIPAEVRVGELQKLVVRCKDSALNSQQVQMDLFLTLCELICKYNVHKDDLRGDLIRMEFVKILSSERLSPSYKVMLLEGVMGMYLCQDEPIPIFIMGIELAGDASLSRSIGKLRGIMQKPDISQFHSVMKIMHSCYASSQPDRYSAAYAVFMWAILPRIMDDDAGANEVIEALGSGTDLQTNQQFQNIRDSAFKMMLEFTSPEHLCTIIPSLESWKIQYNKIIVGCSLSAARRFNLQLALMDLNLTSNHNLSLLLCVMRHVKENSMRSFVDEFYANKLSPMSLAEAIVEAITIIANGKKLTFYLLPESILTLVFFEDPSSSFSDFFDRVRFELNLNMHLSLITKELKLRIIELLCITDGTEKKKEEMFTQFLQREIDSVAERAAALLECGVSKKEQTSDAQVAGTFDMRRLFPLKPSLLFANSSPPSKVASLSKSELELMMKHASRMTPVVEKPSQSKPKPVAPAKHGREVISRGKASASKVAKEELDTNADPIRPSRSRPVRRNTNGSPNLNEQKSIPHQQEEKPKPRSSSNVQKKLPEVDLVSVQQEKRQRNDDKGQPGKPKAEQLQEIAPSIALQSDKSFLNTKSSEDQVEIKKKLSVFEVTTKSLRENATILTDGQVKLSNNCSEEFREYIMEKVKDDILPFKLHPDLLSYLTSGKLREHFKNTNWKTIKNWKEREMWKPKLHSPVKVFVHGVGFDKIVDLSRFVYQLSKEQVARLQSLCYYSTLCTTSDPEVSIKRTLNKHTLNFVISSKASSYRINHGWILLPNFPKNSQDFQNAIASLTKSPATDDSETLIDRRKARLSKTVEQIQVPIADVVLGKEESQVESDIKKPLSHRVDASSNDSVLEENVLTIPPVNIPNKFASMELKATSTEFVPLKKRAAEHLSGLIKNFTKIRFEVTFDSYKAMLTRFSELLQSGVEYVALDCEMTGLYTREDEAEHSKDLSLMRIDNTSKLIRAVGKNLMFQLGLTVKTLDGKYSVWSFYTAPTLTEESFTPKTFEFIFLKPHSNESSKADMSVIQNKINHIASRSVSVAPFLSRMFILRTPIVLFSGYVDLMHILKASNCEYRLTHEQVQEQLECNFYDVKLIAKRLLKSPYSLELLLQKLYPGLKLDKTLLHDASYDSLLTALAFENLRRVYGNEHMIERVLFNYES